jgi:hypothetical protein
MASRPAPLMTTSALGHSRRFGRVPTFRSTPINRHRYSASACLKGAKLGLMRRSKHLAQMAASAMPALPKMDRRRITA